MTSRLARIWAIAVAIALSTALGALAADAPPAFNVDPVHSHVAFRIRHLISHVNGDFTGFSGTITGDPKDPANASVTLTIKAASIDTQNPDRNKHLNSPDFFDTAKYPEITFKSTKITPKGGDRYDVTGAFTMHGVTKEIVVPVTFGGVIKDPWGNDRAGFSVSLTLNRKDYGVSWNKVLDQGGTMVGDEVEISIDLEAVKAAPAKK